MNIEAIANYVGERLATSIAAPLASWGISSQHVAPLAAAAILIVVDFIRARSRKV